MKPDRKKEVKKVLSQEEYERRIAELQKELEELKKVKVEEPKKKGVWIPKVGETYYYLDEHGSIEKTQYMGCNCLWTDFKIIYGNYYKTSEEAFEQYCVQKYTNLFRKYVEEHSEPLDWKKHISKYYLTYSHLVNAIVFDYTYNDKCQGVVYASCEEVLEDAIEFVGKDNIIKYVLGVKEG